jgi:hypothetical protein
MIKEITIKRMRIKLDKKKFNEIKWWGKKLKEINKPRK